MKKHVQVAIIGSPNAGKSSILNAMIQNKNSIVSPKPHTTRRPILGVSNFENTQIVFIDTPGYIRSNTGIWSASFIKSIYESLKDADVILITVDAKNPHKLGTKELLSEFGASQKTLIAINKSDLKKRMNLYPIAQEIASYGYDDVVLLVSAKTGNGLSDLRRMIANKASNDNWLFEYPEQAQISKAQYAAECVREKIFYCLQQEIPFQIWTKTTQFVDDDHWTARVNIYVAHESQKKIVIGSHGNMIKRIGISSRLDLISQWGNGNLFLHVEVDSHKKKTLEEIHRICMMEN